jgi:hypothetical protein
MLFSFEVGERERHRVGFYFNQMWGNVKITVDDRVIQTDFKLFSFNLVKRYDLVVGDDEVHDVVIEHERKLLFAGLRPYKYRAYVDGKLVHDREGY